MWIFDSDLLIIIGEIAQIAPEISSRSFSCTSGRKPSPEKENI